MDSSSTFLNQLPPLKRLRIMHHHQQQQLQHHHNPPLPAKKRKHSPNSTFLHDNPPSPPPTVCSLPAKKRVWAVQPTFDLNVEYDPSLEQPINQIQFFTDPSSPKPQQHPDDDDDDGILCCVCQSTDGDPDDPIVLCDGCDLMVHASCYGNPLSKGVPEGDWFCERCRFDEKGDGFSCCLCPVKEGAMKRTTDNRWAHIVCALLVPEVFFLDPEEREGIDCSKVPKKRWLERCYICDSSDTGCAVVCSEPKCGLAFHVTCGLTEDLCIEYKEGKKGGDTIVAGFCKSHSQIWEKQQQSGKYKIVAIEDNK